MTKNLATRNDVIHHSEFKDTFPPCDLKSIRDVELQIAQKLIGWDFYQLLINNLTNVENVNEWQNDTIYVENTIVKYKGNFFTSIKSTSTQPTLITDWRATPKFQNACYEVFWCEHLARVISLSVFKTHSPMGAAKLTAQGWTQFQGTDSIAASKSAMTIAINGIDTLIDLARNAMYLHIQNLPQNCKEHFVKFQMQDCACHSQTTNDYVSEFY